MDICSITWQVPSGIAYDRKLCNLDSVNRYMNDFIHNIVVYTIQCVLVGTVVEAYAVKHNIFML